MSQKAYKIFENSFSLENLRNTYFSDIQHKSSVGIDRINRSSFENHFTENIQVIHRKVLNGTYRFTEYKERLISKGRDKLPRVISIPTMRDKLVLKVLHYLVSSVFEDKLNEELVHTTISDLKSNIMSPKYRYFLKLDVQGYYPSINHDKLMRIIRRKIRKKEILSLINSAIIQRTVPYAKAEIPAHTQGVPQGLSISNTLASIYLIDFDEKYNNTYNIAYYRYVDDILFLLKNSNVEDLKNEVKGDLEKMNLHLNDEKCKDGSLKSSFDYLGYVATKDGLTVRDRSINKLRDSIIGIITEYKYASEVKNEYLEWHLNLRITGCIYKKKKYGWLFFFSQIDDLSLLYHIDWFVGEIFERFELNINKFKIKRFVRSYHEILYNLSKSNYIPNYSEYSLSEKQLVLKNIFGFDGVEDMKSEEIEDQFNRRIFKSIRELEQDIQTIS